MTSQAFFETVTVTSVRNVVSIHAKPGVPIPRENRPHYALALKAEGRSVYVQGGVEHLSDPTHAVLIPRGASYVCHCLEEGACFLVDFDILCPDEAPASIQSIRLRSFAGLLPLFKKAEGEWLTRRPGWHAACLSALYRIFSAISRARETYPGREKYERIKPAAEYLSEHYREGEVQNKDLAALCGISEVYFRKIFREVWGVSPIRRLHDIRMEKAQTLLAEGYPVADVAEELGYADVYYFSRVFCEATGLSPRRWASAHRAEPQP